MSRDRFVDESTVRLDLSDDDWIEVKKELSVSERKRLEGSPMNAARQDSQSEDKNAVELSMNWDRFFLLKLRLYIVDWSLTKGGKRVPVSSEAINNLKDPDAEEMMAAINKHEQQMKEEEAKNRTGQLSVVKTS